MTTEEFSREFDILYDSIMSNAGLALNEYEKSVFLSQAQETLVVGLYNGNTNNISFESSEEARSYLYSLQKEVSIEVKAKSDLTIKDNQYELALPIDVLFRTYEEATILYPNDLSSTKSVVKPITYDEYFYIQRNPFKGANKNRVLRLDTVKKEVDSTTTKETTYLGVKLISLYPIVNYFVHYIRKPNPIILINLSDDKLSIDGLSKPMTSELPSILHRSILILATQLAKSSWEANPAQV